MKSPLPFYIYLSLIIHCYLILAINSIQKLDFFEKFFTKNPRKTPKIENVFVETFTYSKKPPTDAKLSDKQNQNTSLEKGKNIYNYLNPNPPRLRDKSEGFTEIENKDGNIAVNKKHTNSSKETVLLPEEKLPTLFDPANPLIVQMDNEGEISLGTINFEYADYFLQMQRKISENWKAFFPVFQYYQGIIKTGEVIIRFKVAENGDVLEPEVIKSYGYSILDKSCLNAVIYSRNFGKLPDDLRKFAPIVINFKFIYIAR